MGHYSNLTLQLNVNQIRSTKNQREPDKTSKMNNKKRKRSSNFSKEEEICQLDYIEKYKNTIECKTTNKVSQSEKVPHFKIDHF
jgi:hypothetical protein